MAQQDPLQNVVEQRMDWLLAHPHVSVWLKTSLTSARERPPLDVMNDLEILECVLRAWCEARLVKP